MPGKPYFQDKVFLITGASSGLGREMARLAIKKGARVSCIARREDKLRSLREEVGEQNILCVTGDITDRESIDRLIDLTLGRWKKLDYLLLNAAISAHGDFELLDRQLIDKTMEINFLSNVYTVQKAFPHVNEQKGMIVNISSLLGLVPYAFFSPYVASKHAMRGWMDSLRMELRNKKAGAKVMTAFCGYMKTEITSKSLSHRPMKGIHSHKESLAGQPPEKVARKILAGIQRRKTRLYPVKPAERAFLVLHKIFPSLVEMALLSSDHTPY
jgi:dehydrogenase/reductase SDR family member 7B